VPPENCCLRSSAAIWASNAVVGMRFDHRELTNPWTEVCAYGTAVFVVATRHEPAPPGRQG
jgi:uncharacterized protein YbjQ (UPF0145 family)